MRTRRARKQLDSGSLSVPLRGPLQADRNRETDGRQHHRNRKEQTTNSRDVNEESTEDRYECKSFARCPRFGLILHRVPFANSSPYQVVSRSGIY
jgi:hypothetical protein